MNKSYPVKFIFILLLFIELNSINFGQTSAWGNYEVYSRKNAQSTFDYLTTYLTLPDYRGGYQFRQDGIMYSREYGIANLASILVNSSNEVNISLRGAFRIGAGIGSGTTDSIVTNYSSTNLKYYTATIDFFSMDIAIDYTLILQNGIAIVPRLQLGLIDLGGAVGILDQGVFNQNGMGIISIIPFSIRPSIYFDFGRSTLGFAFFINPYNFLDYRIVPTGLFNSSDSGLIFRDSMVQRYAFQIIFSY
jgi:hypothetical protein